MDARVPRLLAICFALLPAASLHAAGRAIDTANSRMTVHVFKTGVFSALGHDHDISAPLKSGSVDAPAKSVELRVEAAALKVRDANVSDKDRAQIQSTMVGPEVLDAEHFPEIEFRGKAADASGSGGWTVHGELTLHGQTHPVDVQVREEGGHYRGTALLRQSEFGVKPVKVAGGTVKVKDEVRIEFDIQLAR